MVTVASTVITGLFDILFKDINKDENKMFKINLKAFEDDFKKYNYLDLNFINKFFSEYNELYKLIKKEKGYSDRKITGSLKEIINNMEKISKTINFMKEKNIYKKGFLDSFLGVFNKQRNRGRKEYKDVKFKLNYNLYTDLEKKVNEYNEIFSKYESLKSDNSSKIFKFNNEDLLKNKNIGSILKYLEGTKNLDKDDQFKNEIENFEKNKENILKESIDFFYKLGSKIILYETKIREDEEDIKKINQNLELIYNGGIKEDIKNCITLSSLGFDTIVETYNNILKKLINSMGLKIIKQISNDIIEIKNYDDNLFNNNLAKIANWLDDSKKKLDVSPKKDKKLIDSIISISNDIGKVISQVSKLKLKHSDALAKYKDIKEKISKLEIPNLLLPSIEQNQVNYYGLIFQNLNGFSKKIGEEITYRKEFVSEIEKDLKVIEVLKNFFNEIIKNESEKNIFAKIKSLFDKKKFKKSEYEIISKILKINLDEVKKTLNEKINIINSKNEDNILKKTVDNISDDNIKKKFNLILNNISNIKLNLTNDQGKLNTLKNEIDNRKVLKNKEFFDVDQNIKNEIQNELSNKIKSLSKEDLIKIENNRANLEKIKKKYIEDLSVVIKKNKEYLINYFKNISNKKIEINGNLNYQKMSSLFIDKITELAKKSETFLTKFNIEIGNPVKLPTQIFS